MSEQRPPPSAWIDDRRAFIGAVPDGPVVRASLVESAHEAPEFGVDFDVPGGSAAGGPTSIELVLPPTPPGLEDRLAAYRRLWIGGRPPRALAECLDQGRVGGGLYAGALFWVIPRVTASLAEALARGPLDPAEVLDAVRALAQALAFLHASGAAHGSVGLHRVLRHRAGWRLGPPISAARASRADDLAAFSRLVDQLRSPGLPSGSPEHAALARAQAVLSAPGASAGRVWMAIVHPRVDLAPSPHDLRIRRVGDAFELAWTPPTDADLRLLELNATHTLESGDVLLADDLSRAGKFSPSPGRDGARVAPPGSATYALVRLGAAAALVEVVFPLSLLQEVGYPGVQARPDVFHLTFVWPGSARAVRIVWSEERPPTSPTSDGDHRCDLTEEEYTRRGGCSIPRRPGAPIFGRVYTRSPNDPSQFSAGVPWSFVPPT